MNFVDMRPIIDKVKKSIEYSDKTLFIFTDDNPDNLSYIRGIKKVNEKEMFIKSVISIDVNDSKDRDLFKNSFSLTDYIYIMTSVFDNNFVREAVELWPNSCYSEIINNCRKIYPTPKAILDTICYYNNDLNLKGLNIVVANRSQVIGRPLIKMLLDKNATVFCVHTKTNPNTKNMLFSLADIIVTAAGFPNEFKTVGPHKQLIVDAGINVVKDKVCGDWCYNDIEYKSDLYITPNPGGIGKLTTYELFKEVLQ